MLPDDVGDSENIDSASTVKVELHCYNALDTPHCSSHLIRIDIGPELLRHACEYIVRT